MRPKELKEPIRLHLWMEKGDRAWLYKQAAKRRLSISALIRYYIEQAKKNLINFTNA